jgi:hypothetical protein
MLPDIHRAQNASLNVAMSSEGKGRATVLGGA